VLDGSGRSLGGRSQCFPHSGHSSLTYVSSMEAVNECQGQKGWHLRNPGSRPVGPEPTSPAVAVGARGSAAGDERTDDGLPIVGETSDGRSVKKSGGVVRVDPTHERGFRR
jgi:hypothetical protein